MKKIIPLVLFLLLSLSTFAQNTEKKFYKYYRVYESSEKIQGRSIIVVDSGNARFELKNSEGVHVVFGSSIGAVNYLIENRDWEFVQAYTVDGGASGATAVYYIMRAEQE